MLALTPIQPHTEKLSIYNKPECQESPKHSSLQRDLFRPPNVEHFPRYMSAVSTGSQPVWRACAGKLGPGRSQMTLTQPLPPPELTNKLENETFIQKTRQYI